MKNFLQNGCNIVVAAPTDKLSGDGVLVGQIFGVAVADAANGADIVIATEGCYALTKVGSQAWNVGDSVYWDDANSRCTVTAADGVLIGAAIAAVGNGVGETTGNVRLNGIFGVGDHEKRIAALEAA